jgi:hypothetical protein
MTGRGDERMDSQKLHDWLQIVGMAAVVLSLIFVGLQIKQSQDIAIAAQYQARHDANAAVVLAALESEPALRVWGRNIRNDILANPDITEEARRNIGEMPVEEIAVRHITALAGLKNYDNIYFQYQNGFLSEEMWRAMHLQLSMMLSDPGSWARGTYEYAPGVWRESFREVVDEILSEN